MSKNDKKKLEKIVKGHHREKGAPVDIPKLIKIVDKLEQLEAETRRAELTGTYAQ